MLMRLLLPSCGFWDRTVLDDDLLTYSCMNHHAAREGSRDYARLGYEGASFTHSRRQGTK